MGPIDLSRLLATVATFAAIGAAASFSTSASSTASSVAIASEPSVRCMDGACTRNTWLWTPAMRRGGR